MSITMDGGTVFTLCFMSFWAFVALVSIAMMNHTTRRKAIERASVIPVQEEAVKPKPAPRTRKPRTPRFEDGGADGALVGPGFNELLQGATHSETVSGKRLK